MKLTATFIGLALASFSVAAPIASTQDATIAAPIALGARQAGTVRLEIDDDTQDLAIQRTIRADNSVFTFSNLRATDFVINSVNGVSSRVQCFAYSDNAGTVRVGTPAGLNREGNLRTNGGSTQIRSVRCRV